MFDNIGQGRMTEATQLGSSSGHNWGAATKADAIGEH